MNFATRQLRGIEEIKNIPSMIFKALFNFDFKRVVALIVAFFQLIGLVIFDTPVTPYKNEIDMSKFELRWEDNFDKGFDTKYWQGHYVYGANDTQPRDTAMWNRGQVSFTEDGCLLITAEYKEDGPKGAGLNPAFWLLSDGMWADDTDGGITGAEIDILETNTRYDPMDPSFNSIVQTIHVDAYDEAHKWENQGEFYANDPYNEFNTYGVEWNEDEYIFYVNGVETARTSFGGVCRVPLYLIISLGVDERVYENEHLPASMVVDYVKCYQYI